MAYAFARATVRNSGMDVGSIMSAIIPVHMISVAVNSPPVQGESIVMRITHYSNLILGLVA
jgi:hypothetical protein